MMKPFALSLLALPLTFTACVDQPDQSEIDQAATGEQDLHGAPEHVAHGKDARPGGGGGGSPLMTNHGGNVLDAGSVTAAIFWGDWSNPGDKVTGITQFFQGYGGSNYAGTNSEYTSLSGAHVSTASTFQGTYFDTSAAPRKALTTSQAVAEACKMIPNPVENGIYFIYTSTGAGHVSYCAWHSHGMCNGVDIQVAYMPNIDGIAGCSPTSNLTGTNGHSQGLTALINVTGHELSETVTDPKLNAWYDASGAENADKCAWTWSGDVTLKNGSKWTIQQNWSNAAYNANQGNPRGCIQGN